VVDEDRTLKRWPVVGAAFSEVLGGKHGMLMHGVDASAPSYVLGASCPCNQCVNAGLTGRGEQAARLATSRSQRPPVPSSPSHHSSRVTLDGHMPTSSSLYATLSALSRSGPLAHTPLFPALPTPVTTSRTTSLLPMQRAVRSHGAADSHHQSTPSMFSSGAGPPCPLPAPPRCMDACI
jgi:hypothetical protein